MATFPLSSHDNLEPMRELRKRARMNASISFYEDSPTPSKRHSTAYQSARTFVGLRALAGYVKEQAR
jgi:hypothetical protein